MSHGCTVRCNLRCALGVFCGESAVSSSVTCQHCGKTLRVKDSLAASLRFCPFCKGEIGIGQAVVPASAASVNKGRTDPFAKPAPPVVTSAPAEVGRPPSGGAGEG